MLASQAQTIDGLRALTRSLRRTARLPQCGADDPCSHVLLIPFPGHPAVPGPCTPAVCSERPPLQPTGLPPSPQSALALPPQGHCPPAHPHRAPLFSCTLPAQPSAAHWAGSLPCCLLDDYSLKHCTVHRAGNGCAQFGQFLMWEVRDTNEQSLPASFRVAKGRQGVLFPERSPSCSVFQTFW